MRNRRLWGVARDTVVGTWADGFTHAGNLAYLSLLTLFPFIIILATVAGSLGRTEDGMLAIQGFLRALPPNVAALVAKPIDDVVTVRASSGLLTFGILVTLWTSSGFIETIRSIIHDAYQVPQNRAVWRNRIGSVLIIFAAVLLMLAAFAAQVVLTGAETFVARLMPYAEGPLAQFAIGRLFPAGALFVALFLVFLALTPQRFVGLGYPVWPGALATTLVWVLTTMVMPGVLQQFGAYTLTYGSLAGVIVALLFFYIVGLGLVFGAQLNAALARSRQRQLKTFQQT
ncbi:MAG: YihY/virulence factor BrkB family protein [Sandarakinorhabdus sp.]|nr:YihY/virulence factor BrkB family protein [Sandarakinorhabdus sp.]